MALTNALNDSPPPRKRARQTCDDKSDHQATNPRLFVPFRALGLVTNHVPCVLQTRSFKGATEGPRVHILTCLDKSWALWEGGKMTLLFVGPEAPAPISSLTMEGDFIWATSGRYIIKYLRGKEVSLLTNPLDTTLSFTTIFGPQVISLLEDGSRMMIWNSTSGELESEIRFESDFSASGILHPATYINKILVSSRQGTMQLWNTRTQTCIYKFTLSKLCSSPTTGGPTSISALTQSPAIDVVGIGFSSGEISVYDVRADERLIRIFMDGGQVTALGFRSDGQPILVSASSAGHLAVWDLNSGGTLLHMIRGAHEAAINSVEWIPGQPVLVTSSEDNSVKQWLFDSPDAAPRVLKYRAGHRAPPHLIRYYGDDGKQLLTASGDRSLRCTSVVRDSRSFELSQGSLAKKAASRSTPLSSLKFPPITAISHSSTRAKDWDDVITAHSEDAFARTWTLPSKRTGKHSFKAQDGVKLKTKGKEPVDAYVKSVCVTACGNFGLVGSSTGGISMWNMQSGILRRTFTVGPCPPEVMGRLHASDTEKKVVPRPITGLATDALNQLVLVSTLDGTINFFNFHLAKLEHTLILPSATSSISLHRDSGLLAVVCEDMVIRIIDIETRRIVRELSGFKSRILDIAFSPDSRWLVASSLDSIIRTFDLPSGCLIDAFRTSSVATSLAFSPTNDFLATSHIDSVGVYLWANRAQYADVALKSIQEVDVSDASLPTMHGTAEDDEVLHGLSALTTEDKPIDPFATPTQLDGDLITLTLLPRSRWQTLLNLEVIQQRNKPKEPPKAPEQAPFFLPTLPGVEPRFAVEDKATGDQQTEKSRRLEKSTAHLESHFYKKLTREKEDGDYESFFNYMKTLSPAAIDLELRSLVTIPAIRVFLNALRQRLLSHRDFEATQTFLSVFLQIHSDVLIANSELHGELEKLKEIQQKESGRVLELISSCLGTLSFLRDNM
ncbi:hypothetical protein PC9H_000990 [Pleurotus ostreatus]|uniref:Small-subunit processome Utp21 domain-containing protein n=1 Tax=Pleurotus ostreatus TaxID=5322 RepID=A0A8H7A2Y1_PLEOS|nr:uncharacterized protein PC9H_000990 [Pleurotus ostreatus]KAF7440643.1 hypothetical protein PC9H_000990 [Pleurotus ostreatus]